MTPDRWIVTASGLALIAFIVWFFWLKRSTGFRATETSGGYQEAMILVKGGYTPDTIIVPSARATGCPFKNTTLLSPKWRGTRALPARCLKEGRFRSSARNPTHLPTT